VKARLFLAALAALAVAAPASVADAQQRRAAQRDWTATVVATPEGGFRMGNPNAEVRIVEFLSLTCPHCRHFAAEGMPQLLPQVRSGRISVEYRNLVLNALDLSAAMLSRCATPANYFRFSNAIMAGQDQWMPRVQNMAQLDLSTPAQAMQQLARISSASGLETMAQRFGLTPAQARACMADGRGLARLLEMNEAAQALGVNSTPSFLINGRLAQGVHDWSELAPLIAARR